MCDVTHYFLPVATFQRPCGVKGGDLAFWIGGSILTTVLPTPCISLGSTLHEYRERGSTRRKWQEAQMRSLLPCILWTKCVPAVVVSNCLPITNGSDSRVILVFFGVETLATISTSKLEQLFPQLAREPDTISLRAMLGGFI